MVSHLLLAPDTVSWLPGQWGRFLAMWHVCISMAVVSQSSWFLRMPVLEEGDDNLYSLTA